MRGFNCLARLLDWFCKLLRQDLNYALLEIRASSGLLGTLGMARNDWLEYVSIFTHTYEHVNIYVYIYTYIYI